MSYARLLVDELWNRAYALSSATGCAFPGEPSGHAVRAELHLLRTRGPVRHDESERVTIDAIARCAACFGGCTATSRI